MSLPQRQISGLAMSLPRYRYGLTMSLPQLYATISFMDLLDWRTKIFDFEEKVVTTCRVRMRITSPVRTDRITNISLASSVIQKGSKVRGQEIDGIVNSLIYHKWMSVG